MALCEADRTLLGRLIATDTTSGRPTGPALDLLADRLDDAGCLVARFDADGQGRESLVALAGPVDAAGGLSLSGHIDTVPAGDGWSGDPFDLAHRDGRWYGRGTCDMKGFVSLATNIVAESARRSLTSPLALIVTADEELGSIGASDLVNLADRLPPLPRSCVVGEPTSMRVVRMHKGHCKFTITVTGATGHTGTPGSGVNAVDGVARVVSVLRAEADRLAMTRTPASEAFTGVPWPVLAPVRIGGGSAWNVIPGEARVDVGLRVLPDQSVDAVLDEIRAALKADLPDVSWTLAVYNDNPPMCAEGGCDIDVACRALVGQDKDIGVSYCSDGGHLSRLGLECVLFGPGDIAVAHQPDEFVPESDLITAREHVERLVEASCIGAGA